MSKLMRRCSVMLAVAILAMSLAGGMASAATSRQQEIEQEKRVLRDKIRAADSQALTLSRQIADSDARRAALEAEIKSMTSQLKEAEARLATAEVSLGVARSDLYSAESTLAQALDRVERMRKAVNERTRLTYKAGGAAYLELLLGAEDFRDFVSRLSFVRNVITADRDRLQAVKSLSQKLDESRTEALQRRDDISSQKDAIVLERAKVASLQESLKSKRAGVVAEIQNRQSLLTKVKADKAGYLREMTRLEAESRSIAALLKSRQRGQVYKVGSGNKLAWPTTGSVTSSYGYRTHPIFGDRRFHSGIDISGPSGQSVVAAEAGQVVFAGVKGGYGLTVIIDHGNALATLYAHLSSVSVSNGSTVSRASRIAAVGCSGYCTGPHLHFETRINGETRDPMAFF